MYSLKVHIVTHEDDGTTHGLPQTGEEQSSTYVKVVNILLKSYGIDTSIAKAALDIACIKRVSTETYMQLTDVHRSKVVRYENAYLGERTNEVCIDTPPASTQSAVRMFWCHEQDALFLDAAQYAETLLKQTKQVTSVVMALVRRSHFQGGHRTTPILASVAKQRFMFAKNIHYVTQTSGKRPFLNRKDMVGTIEPKKQRIVVYAWQMIMERRRAHILSALESFLRKEKLIICKCSALVPRETPTEDSTAHAAIRTGTVIKSRPPVRRYMTKIQKLLVRNI